MKGINGEGDSSGGEAGSKPRAAWSGCPKHPPSTQHAPQTRTKAKNSPESRVGRGRPQTPTASGLQEGATGLLSDPSDVRGGAGRPPCPGLFRQTHQDTLSNDPLQAHAARRSTGRGENRPSRVRGFQLSSCQFRIPGKNKQRLFFAVALILGRSQAARGRLKCSQRLHIPMQIRRDWRQLAGLGGLAFSPL